MPKIFISYRRADSQDQTERIHDRLVQAFGRENVFLDVDEGYIPSGSDFATVLRDAVRKCDVLLVIIGPDWLDVRESGDPNLRRLDNPDDFVRIEVETGLQNSSTLVIPVLVKDAQPLRAAELPDSIRDLTKIQVERIRRNPDFHKDVVGLIELIRGHFPKRRGLYLGMFIAIVTLLVVAGVILATNRGVGTNITLSDTPEPATAVVLLLTERAGETLTAVAPTMTDTPDLTRTVDALVTQYFFTETAYAAETMAAYTYTPTATFTPSITPSATEDRNATATGAALTQAALQQAEYAQLTLDAENTRDAQQASDAQATLNAQATANVPTNTPQPTRTTTPPPTATLTRTPAATATLTATLSPTPTVTLTPTIDLTGTANAAATQTQVAANNATQAVLAAQNALDAQATATQAAQATMGQVTGVSAKNGFLLLTANNIELGYAVSGNCSGFSPDGTLLATEDGVYEVATGEKRFEINGEGDGLPALSSDGTLLAVAHDGVYEVSTGEERFPISGYYPTFSPDGTLLASGDDGVYEVSTGEERFPISGILSAFSPDGTLLVVGDNRVYEVSTGEERFEISGFYSAFSRDGTLLATGDGVYEVATGEIPFTFSGDTWDHSDFSPDGTLLATGDGVYEVATGEKRFEIGEAGYVLPDFNPDGTLLAVTHEGVYEVATGEKRFTFSGFPDFSPDGTLLAVGGSRSCKVYGSLENQWPFRSGVIHVTSRVNIRQQPTTNSEVLVVNDPGDLTVIAHSRWQLVSSIFLPWNRLGSSSSSACSFSAG